MRLPITVCFQNLLFTHFVGVYLYMCTHTCIDVHKRPPPFSVSLFIYLCLSEYPSTWIFIYVAITYTHTHVPVWVAVIWNIPRFLAQSRTAAPPAKRDWDRSSGAPWTAAYLRVVKSSKSILNGQVSVFVLSACYLLSWFLDAVVLYVSNSVVGFAWAVAFTLTCTRHIHYRKNICTSVI